MAAAGWDTSGGGQKSALAGFGRWMAWLSVHLTLPRGGPEGRSGSEPDRTRRAGERRKRGEVCRLSRCLGGDGLGSFMYNWTLII